MFFKYQCTFHLVQVRPENRPRLDLKTKLQKKLHNGKKLNLMTSSINVISSGTGFFQNFGGKLPSCKNHRFSAFGFRDRQGGKYASPHPCKIGCSNNPCKIGRLLVISFIFTSYFILLLIKMSFSYHPQKRKKVLI